MHTHTHTNTHSHTHTQTQELGETGGSGKSNRELKPHITATKKVSFHTEICAHD